MKSQTFHWLSFLLQLNFLLPSLLVNNHSFLDHKENLEIMTF